MKPDTAIEIEGLSKTYQLRHGLKTGDGTVRELVALKDLNLTIRRGEFVGISGPNGGGKSTLLKILAGVTKPTTGRALLRGRVGSILEIGSGFQPELTGRDNIYVSGRVIGFSNPEIVEQFDRIVEFSGIGPFIDEPVKFYSNGMYLRLAFSIIIHLKCDILLLDEVLAVGDQEFMAKCITALKDKRKEGTTILLVSHDRELLSYLSDRIVTIMDHSVQSQDGEFFDPEDRFLVDSDISIGKISDIVTEDSIELRIQLCKVRGYSSLDLGISFDPNGSIRGRFVICSLHAPNELNTSLRSEDTVTFFTKLPRRSLKEGEYSLSAYSIKDKKLVTANFNQCYKLCIPQSTQHDRFLSFYPNPLRLFTDWQINAS